jgi:hypothetical protein
VADQPGFEIYKAFYPVPERFRLGDPVLVREVTGMEWPQFIEALNQMEVNEETDEVVMLGLMAVAFWQGNPDMSRAKVRQVLERVWQEDAELIGGDEVVADGPPAEGGVTPPTTPNESEDSAVASSDVTSPNGSGTPASDTSTPEPTPA